MNKFAVLSFLLVLSGCVTVTNGKGDKYVLTTNGFENKQEIAKNEETNSAKADTSSFIDYDYALNASYKLRPHYALSSIINDYLKVYKRKTWEQYQHDEFRLQEQKDIALKEWNNKINTLSLTGVKINTDFTFDKYNFEKQLFPLEKFSENNYFPLRKSFDLTANFPRQYKIYIKNYDFVRDLHMQKNLAAEFIKARKNKYGGINRKLKATLTVNILGLLHGQLNYQRIFLWKYQKDR